jgi:hypothetical protein
MAYVERMKNYNSFKTRKSVYDGGGVLPDIQRKKKTNPIANALLKKMMDQLCNCYYTKSNLEFSKYLRILTLDFKIS